MCSFNAMEKLKRRRFVSQDLNLSAAKAAELIREIDEARWHHFETTGCDCWEQARAELQQALAAA